MNFTDGVKKTRDTSGRPANSQIHGGSKTRRTQWFWRERQGVIQFSIDPFSAQAEGTTFVAASI